MFILNNCNTNINFYTFVKIQILIKTTKNEKIYLFSGDAVNNI